MLEVLVYYLVLQKEGLLRLVHAVPEDLEEALVAAACVVCDLRQVDRYHLEPPAAYRAVVDVILRRGFVKRHEETATLVACELRHIRLVYDVVRRAELCRKLRYLHQRIPVLVHTVGVHLHLKFREVERLADGVAPEIDIEKRVEQRLCLLLVICVGLLFDLAAQLYRGDVPEHLRHLHVHVDA